MMANGLLWCDTAILMTFVYSGGLYNSGYIFFFSSRGRHTRSLRDWSSDVCSSDLTLPPQSMSLIVTRPIEQVVMAVPGVRRVRSRSIRGAAEISAQFDPTTDMVTALQMVQNRVAEITGDLPMGTQLQIERMTPAIFPVFIMSLTGSLPTADLYDYANFVVKPELARVPGAGTIEVQASDTREIEVVLDPARLVAAQLTVVDVSDALLKQNTILPVGRFAESGQQHLTLASGLWKNAGEIAN